MEYVFWRWLIEYVTLYNRCLLRSATQIRTYRKVLRSTPGCSNRYLAEIRTLTVAIRGSWVASAVTAHGSPEILSSGASKGVRGSD